ncbi:hypothetical protein H0G86_009559 [Trichoderma simmonsii]|uniref:Uncharacterized protein n=1 Tax=Trichoderma simmonsii TaxID=1491479 RepID=A0A8G0LHT4_9HYPO|nr:hypothetical protein H0G86_009559 [Trichoderma simmonsii]
MGVDCGFDVHPTLGLECRDLYEAFLEEVVQKYKQAVHPNTGKPLVQIVGSPGTQNAYIYFNVGEGPILPYNIDYFIRFESGLVDDVMKYLKEVYLIARRYFPNNVQFWVSGASPSLIQEESENKRRKMDKASRTRSLHKVNATGIIYSQLDEAEAMYSQVL